MSSGEQRRAVCAVEPDQPAAGGTASRGNSPWLLPALLLAALTLRLAFFTGCFGSDEVTYTEQALKIAQGEWARADYIGAVRLGISLPVGFLVWILGRSEFVANLWSLLCSLGEIALVYLIARRFWGERAAVLSGLVLAFTPLHAHYAGRLMADAPLAFFISLSFFALFEGDRSGRRAYYLCAGLAAGFVWWIKSSVALVYVLVFALYVVRERRLHSKWLLMATGFLAMLVLNGLLFLIMEGDFWKIWRMTTSGAAEYVQKVSSSNDPTFYVRLLLLDIKHTWLLGPLAVAGLLLWLTRNRHDDGLNRIAIWCLGLIGVFSLFIVSFKPLLLITKQVNYAIVFLAPLALLAGYALSRLGRGLAALVAVAVIIPLGIIGTALEQQVIQSFVANSKAALLYARERPDSVVFGMTSAIRTGNYARLFATSPTDAPRIADIQLLASGAPGMALKADADGFVAYAVFDRQTADWGQQGPYSHQEDLPRCWHRLGELEPTGMGLGARIVSGLRSAAAILPTAIAEKVARQLDLLARPLPATIYGIRADCLAATADAAAR
ncbi:MAG: putative membrane protein [Candidatus Accumulibacter adjunctus]|uniref:Membrane protein n=1 Tax=Candidatus Accumulibacter adjunctus TaxID=1454001 RepID=A0A011NX77_9PROT|nr:MAG: putative membrane protein [Candidatus Accumulibacter adjunctus]